MTLYLIQICARPCNLAFFSEQIPLSFVSRQGSVVSVGLGNVISIDRTPKHAVVHIEVMESC